MTSDTSPDPEIAVLALPEATPSSIFGLVEVLSSVGRAWEMLTSEATDVAPLNIRIVAADGRDVSTRSGQIIKVGAGLGHADVIIVGDLALHEEFAPGGCWPRETRWLAERFERGAIVCSACTGAVALAEAGLLNGKTATTHWAAARLLAQHYPDIKLEPSRILVPAGENHRIITSGGSASWEDLALYLTGRFRGAAEAIRISKIFLFGDRSEGQLPFSVADPPLRHDDAVIAEIQVWLADNYAVANPVRAMTSRSGLNSRTLTRRFRAATGYSPIDYVQTLRLEEAKQLLETTEIQVDDLSEQVGYEDPTHFRRMFKRRTGTTPSKYRRMFARLGRQADAADRAALPDQQ